jgi:hypothetical protein
MRDDLSKLRRNAHWVSPKVDGVRMFLLFSFVEDTDYAVLVNRAGKMTPVSIRAPDDVYSGTLLDGELVKDKKTGHETYVVFDAIAVNGYSLTKKAQSERMSCVTRTVSSLVTEVNLKVEVKRWFPLGRVSLEEVSGSVTSPTDGFIFVPESGSALHPGPQRDHYKWKPLSHHTIDMFWKDGELWVERGGIPTRARDELNVSVVKSGEVIAAEGSIVECSLSREVDGSWAASFVRVRDDKLQPNDLKVASLTLQNISENIRLEELE